MTCDVSAAGSFQGPEQGIVILSCVRDHNSKGRSGFVADARKLNVAIIRAKKLLICGHLGSFQDTKEWVALVSDTKGGCKVREISVNCSKNFLS